MIGDRGIERAPEALEGMRILMIDDEEANLRALTRLLDRAGYREVQSTSDPREGADLFRAVQPDLLLLDLRMPYLDGFEVMEALGALIPPQEYFPILVLTGDMTPEVRERALRSGARDFLNKPFDLTEVLLRIRNLLETRLMHLRLAGHAATLEERVQERTRELALAQVEILQRLALAAEYRDDITGHHAERVGVVSALLARELGLPEEEVQVLRRAATLHDVGKIGIPDAILLKPGPLTALEYEIMKSHTEIGGRILSGSGFLLLQMAQEVALSHHERWDGDGYAGLAGEAIPLPGRIVVVADVFDSLCNVRPYKSASTPEASLAEVIAGKGTHFDPAVVEAFLALAERGVLEQVDEIVQRGMMEPVPLLTSERQRAGA